jgi:hypothetical protein
MLTETFPSASTGGTSSRDEQPHVSRRTYADILALDRALVLADLPAARAAFLHLQEDLPLIAAAMSSDPFPFGVRPQRTLQQLAHCLASDDLSGARQAFNVFVPPASPAVPHETRTTRTATLA